MSDLEGLVYGLDDPVYRAIEGLSSTEAKELLKSPAHYQWYKSNPPVYKPEYDTGSAVHWFVLGAGSEPVVIPEDVLSKTGTIGTAAAKQFIQDSRDNGQIPMKQADLDYAKRIADAVTSDANARALFSNGQPEVSMFGTDPETGVRMKGRLDWLSTRIVDLKTTAGSASEHDFAKDAFNRGYHVQYGWYTHLYELITGDTLPWLFVVVEKNGPFNIGIHRFGEDEILIGRHEARKALRRYARAIETGHWPGYTTRSGGPIGVLLAPTWNINEYIDGKDSE